MPVGLCIRVHANMLSMYTVTVVPMSTLDLKQMSCATTIVFWGVNWKLALRFSVVLGAICKRGMGRRDYRQ